eukprot:gene47070-58730_t
MTIGPNVVSIGESAFYNNAVTTLVLPATLQTIGECAFRYAEKITSMSIPASVTTIGSNAWSHCTALTTITFETRTTDVSLGSGLFNRSPVLATVTLPSTLTVLPMGTFYQCTSLTTIYLPVLTTTIGDFAFQSSGLTCRTDYLANQMAGTNPTRNLGFQVFQSTPLQTNGMVDVCSGGGARRMLRRAV